MRIGLFTDTYFPQVNGVATSVRMLKENLESLGHDVFVFTTTDPNAPENERGVFRVISLPFVSERRIALAINPFTWRALEHLKLDIIHTHTEFSLGILGRMAAKEMGIPLVHTLHTKYEDYTHYIFKFNLLNPLAKSAAKKLSLSFCNIADEVIVPTEKIREMLNRYGMEKDVNIIPTGIRIDKFSPDSYSEAEIQSIRQSLGLSAEDKVILYVGRISDEKNIDEVFYNLKPYLSERDNVKFVIIGDGPHKENLMALVNKLGLERNTIFAGERTWEVIGAYYHIGDVFVSASQSETQGLTYIEALAAGLPVVAKDDPCLVDVVENGVNGYTFTDRENFICNLNKILLDSKHSKNLAVGALETAKRFSAQGYAQSVLSVYESLVYTMCLREGSKNA